MPYRTYVYFDSLNSKSSTTYVSDSLLNMPEPFRYLWIHFTSVILPEEETITVLFIKTLNRHFQYPGRLLFNDIIIPTIKCSVYLILLLFIIYNKKTRLCTLANAIPLGGHAPPL
jgi:hypothetical protein